MVEGAPASEVTSVPMFIVGCGLLRLRGLLTRRRRCRIGVKCRLRMLTILPATGMPMRVPLEMQIGMLALLPLARRPARLWPPDETQP